MAEFGPSSCKQLPEALNMEEALLKRTVNRLQQREDICARDGVLELADIAGQRNSSTGDSGNVSGSE